LVPLQYNASLFDRQLWQQRSFSDIFVYEIDTLDLPFMDDFSRDNFKNYNAQPGDANVTLQKFYHLYDNTGTVVLDDSVHYMTSTTYLFSYDTTGGSLQLTLTALDSFQILVNDLTEYPINGTLTWVRPRYNLIDSVWDALPADTQWIATADLVQDSVNVYFVSPAGDNSIWIDRFAYRNNRYAIGPPTIGVATFDGLDLLTKPGQEHREHLIYRISGAIEVPIWITVSEHIREIGKLKLHEESARRISLIGKEDLTYDSRFRQAASSARKTKKQLSYQRR
jgi:hypothetical protein